MCIRWAIKYAVFISLNDSAKEIKFSQSICVCNVVAICTDERKGRAVWYFISSLPLAPLPKEKYSTGNWKISLWGVPWFVTFTRHYWDARMGGHVTVMRERRNSPWVPRRELLGLRRLRIGSSCGLLVHTVMTFGVQKFLDDLSNRQLVRKGCAQCSSLYEPEYFVVCRKAC